MATDVYLKVVGLSGNSQDNYHQGWFDIFDWRWTTASRDGQQQTTAASFRMELSSGAESLRQSIGQARIWSGTMEMVRQIGGKNVVLTRVDLSEFGVLEYVNERFTFQLRRFQVESGGQNNPHD